MKKILLILFLFLCIHNNFAQDTAVKTEIKKELGSLLPAKTATAEIIDSIKQNPRIAELTMKLKLAISENYDWFVDYMANNKTPLPYHKNFRLSETEYSEVLNTKMESIPSGTSEITILRNKTKIQFKAQGKLAVLESVTIDLEQNVVFVGENKLPFSEKVVIDTDTNGLKSKWKGYNWKLEEPEDFDISKLKNPETITLKMYKLTVGKLEKNGKTFMRLECKEFENAEKKVNVDIPITF